MLPAWLGMGDALQALIQQGKLEELQAMYAEWPFVTSTFDLVEMVRPRAGPCARYRCHQCWARQGGAVHIAFWARHSCCCYAVPGCCMSSGTSAS